MPFLDPECVEVVDTLTFPTDFQSGEQSAPFIVEDGRFIHVGVRDSTSSFGGCAWVIYDIVYDYDAGTFTSVTELEAIYNDGSTYHVNHNATREVWHFPDENAFVCWANHNKVSGDSHPNVTFLQRFVYDGSGVSAGGPLITHTVDMNTVGEDDLVTCPTSTTALLLGGNFNAG